MEHLPSISASISPPVEVQVSSPSNEAVQNLGLIEAKTEQASQSIFAYFKNGLQHLSCFVAFLYIYQSGDMGVYVSDKYFRYLGRDPGREVRLKNALITPYGHGLKIYCGKSSVENTSFSSTMKMSLSSYMKQLLQKYGEWSLHV